MGFGVRWTDEEKEYLSKITPGHHYKEIVYLMNEKFERTFTIEMIKGAIGRYKLNTGFNGRFKKGNIPHNKGLSMCYPGCERTWFKKGNLPLNHKKVGSERVDRDGYTLIKVAEPNQWKLKHRVIWEQVNGPIPKGYSLIFADKDKTNMSLDNLILVSRKELMVINRRNLIKDNAELTKSGVNLSKLLVKISDVSK